MALLLTLSACSSLPIKEIQTQWRYDVATNVDEILHTETRFFNDGEMIYRDHGSGSLQGVTKKNLAEKNYRWFIGGGFNMERTPLPNQANIRWFSYYDRTNYTITFPLPQNLASLMCQTSLDECSNTLIFALAPGGYVQIRLRKEETSATLLLAEGMADIVNTNQTFSHNNNQLGYALSLFERTFLNVYQQHPIPYGQTWQTIMKNYSQPFIE
jgi:hypothetical protein